MRALSIGLRPDYGFREKLNIILLSLAPQATWSLSLSINCIYLAACLTASNPEEIFSTNPRILLNPHICSILLPLTFDSLFRQAR